MMLLEFVAFYSFIFLFGYLLPAGQFYLVFHVRKSSWTKKLQLQDRSPTPEGVQREFQMSLITILIFSALATIVFQFYKAGWTSIYWDFREYPLIYLPISFVLCLVLYDTYFYWTHRLMHWNRIFKYVHLGHHRSVTPSPWAIFAFQPLEAVIQFAGVAALVFLLPLHPLVLLAFLSFDTLVNTAGHTGHEVVPRRLGSHRLFTGWNTVTHHDLHHTNVRVNFGVFFNVWDRLMGTFQNEVEVSASQPTSNCSPMAERTLEFPKREFTGSSRPLRSLVPAAARRPL